MAGCLQGFTIALLAADGVSQVVLETSGEVVRQAGARTQLLSLTTGYIESLDSDRGPGCTHSVERTVAQAKADEYDALLLVPGTMKPNQLSSDDIVLSFVRDFITSGKPVAVVCHGAWTLLEAGVARSRALPSQVTLRALRQTGASILDGEPISPHILRAFYRSIVDEFARLAGQPTAGLAQENQHRWTQSMVLPTL